jgi:peptidoglycan/xylan/chitin deacetylase (PgdA/CDA1 family)
MMDGMSQPLVVLCYHAISEVWRSSMSATPAQLERHVGALLRRGYAPLTFTAAARGEHPGPCFAVTFDDAFASVAGLAFPLLERLGVPATVFVPTSFADDGGQPRWDGLEPWAGGEYARELRAMSWQHLAALRDAGWEIGSHTVSHPRLPELDDRRLADELTRSRRRCEQMLAVPCTSIAYPYGAVDARVSAAALVAGYRAGAALASPPAPAGNPLEVPRVGVGQRDRSWRFAVKTSATVLTLRTRLAV